MKTLSVLILTIGLASACTWVKVSEEAEEVVVGKESNVRGCEQLSETNVTVADHIGPIQRGDDKIAEELIAMGKNEAARLDGDTIVPRGKPEDGRQTFTIYRCD